MTEQDWLVCEDVRAMLKQIHGLVSNRKLRCFACACARSVETLLFDARSHRAIEAAYNYADGVFLREELSRIEQEAFALANEVDLQMTLSIPGWAATRSAARTLCLDASLAAEESATYAIHARSPWTISMEGEVLDRGDPAARAKANRRICDLLREVVGNPFRAVVRETAWAVWNRGMIRQLAEEIYQSRRFDELSVLADALEDGGCEQQPLLEHLRSPHEHVRGCWALDLILDLR